MKSPKRKSTAAKPVEITNVHPNIVGDRLFERKNLAEMKLKINEN
jgi:hypothetical protein